MKKVLIASTALVAATMFTAGAASASEKIKLNLGGFSKWWVVGQWQDDSFQSNANTAGTQGDYNSVDVKGDNEIYIGGSTTLDNGLKVGIDIQLEGQTETNSDVIDESYVWLEGGFGKIIAGSKNNGAYLLHVTAPDAAGNWNEGGIMTGHGTAIVKPANVNTVTPLSGTGNTTAILTDGDSDGITYVAPSFYGLTVGASYKPSSSEDDRGTTAINTVGSSHTGQTTGEIYGAGALYSNTFGGVGVKVSGGYAIYDLNQGNALAQGKDGVQEYTTGAQLSYAGFTLGGSYRKVNTDGNATGATDLEANAWDVGLQYASGPYAISLAYFNSEAGGTRATAGDDEITFYQLSGKYALGAGVDALASVGYAEFEDETNLQANENKGWVVMTGLSLAF